MANETAKRIAARARGFLSRLRAETVRRWRAVSRQDIRKRIFDVLEIASLDDPHAKAFYSFLVGIISLNVAAVMLETVPCVAGSPCRTVFRIFDWLSVAAFALEYALRIWSCTADEQFADPKRGRLAYVLTPFTLLDLVALLPSFLPFLGLDLRFIRAVRLVRLVRLFKKSRYAESLATVNAVIREKKEELAIVFTSILFMLVLSSSLMYFVEHRAQPAAFSSIPAALWWAVMTLTTVGYGDIVPVTPLGKMLTSFIVLIGVGLFALPVAVLAGGFTEEFARRRKNGRGTVCPHCGGDLTAAPPRRRKRDAGPSLFQ